MAKISKERETECRDQLLKLVAPGQKIYCVLRHVSRSGMQRRIDLFTIVDEEMRYLTRYAADLCGYTVHRDGGAKLDGCGRDMGFAFVYQLGARLWPNGTKKPHGHRNGEPDSAGGYALKHEWL